MRLARSDEFGGLSDYLQTLTDNLRHERDEAGRARGRIKGLLARYMPARIVRPLGDYDAESEGADVSDSVADLTVVIVEITGYPHLLDVGTSDEGVAMLDMLIRKIDAAVAAAGIEKIRTAGPSYVAATALSTPQIDRPQRALTFVQALVGFVERFRAESSLPLHVTVRVASGPVVAAVMGERLKAFELFGAPKEEARHVSFAGGEDKARVGPSVAARLDETLPLTPAPDGAGLILERIGAATEAAE